MGVRALEKWMEKQETNNTFPSRKAFQEEAATPEATASLGASGVLRDGAGLPLFDPTPEMHPVCARGLFDDHGTYHEMVTGDPVIAGVIALIRREMTRAPYRVVVPTNPSPAEEEAGRLISRYFGIDGRQPLLKLGLRHLISHASLAIIYGFSPMEMTWSNESFEGSIVRVPSGLHWRAPWSVERWLWQGEMLVGMQQVVQTASQRTTRPSSHSILGSSFLNLSLPDRRVLPINRLLLFTHDGTDGNPEGRSMLRPAYRYFQLKKRTLIRIEMAEESLWGGITTIQELINPKTGAVYDDVSDAYIDLAGEVAVRRARGEINVVAQPAGLNVSTNFPDYEIRDRRGYLEYIDHQLLMSVLGTLLGLASSQAASAAISGGLGSVLYNSIDDIAAGTVEPINMRLIPTITQANIAEARDPEFRHPRLEAVGIAQQDPKSTTDNMAKARQFMLTSWSDRDEAQYRAQQGMVELTPEEMAEARASRAPVRMTEEGTQAPQAGTAAGDMS